MVSKVDYYKHNEAEYKNYMKTYPPTQVQNARVADMLVERLKGLRWGSCLEVGCGYSLMTRVLMKNFRGKTYTCMDLSEDQVEAAKKYLSWHYERKKVKIFQGDIIHYRSKKKYDLVLSTTVLSHIPEQYVEKAIENVCALAKMHIVIVEPTTEVIARLKKNDDQWLHNYRLLFARQGWGIVDIKRVVNHLIQYIRFQKVRLDG